MILPFNMAPKYSAEAQSRVPECKKSTRGLMEKLRVLDKLCPGMRCNAIGCDFNINEPMIYTVFKQKHIKQGCVLIG